MNDYFLNIAPEDPEGDAFEAWQCEVDLTEVLDTGLINEALWWMYNCAGTNIAAEVQQAIEHAWQKEIDRRIEDSHDYF